jgi:hypothetical protein
MKIPIFQTLETSITQSPGSPRRRSPTPAENKTVAEQATETTSEGIKATSEGIKATLKGTEATPKGCDISFIPLKATAKGFVTTLKGF